MSILSADVGIWIYAHVPAPHDDGTPPDWIYNHMSLGPGTRAFNR
jgi:hypothetical protein